MARSPAPPAAPVAAPPERGDEAPISAAERAVLEAVRGLAYGQIEVVVHGSRIVQITRSQKLRLDD
jgi:hypothetical protein